MLVDVNRKKVKNILIFVSDSLRWDHLPKTVSDKGMSFKTIASSLYTGTSFPSMISGLYPPSTNCYSWEDILPPKYRGLFDLDGLNSSLWCETTWTDLPPWESQIHHILGKPDGISLDEIETPFIFMEDDKGGHCPYGVSDGSLMGGGCSEFYRAFGERDNDELREEYRKGVEISCRQFESRLNVLKERGILDETLVIFTSDHGELLGEYGGLVAHGRPACPELVYVPTVFIHPSIEGGVWREGVFRHIDLLPTIAGILGKKLRYEPDGLDQSREHDPIRSGMSFRKGGYLNSTGWRTSLFSYDYGSVWDENGGHVFHEKNRMTSIPHFLYLIFFGKTKEFVYLRGSRRRKTMRERLSGNLTALRTFTKRRIEYGSPGIEQKDALNMITEFETSEREDEPIESERFEVDEETKKRLEALGYMD